MNRAKKIIPFLLGGILLLGFAVKSDADGITSTNAPGSTDDPIVTKSYVDEQIRRITGGTVATGTTATQAPSSDEIKQIVDVEVAKAKDEMLSQLKQTQAPVTPPDSKSPVQTGTTTEKNSGSTVIKLEQGQTLYGGAGTEFIVRTGKAVVFSTDTNGIADVTAGKDILGDTAIELNHLLVIPRDGRGIRPEPKISSDIYVMVKGSYLLTNGDGTKVAP